MRSRNQKNFMWMPLSKNNRQSGIYRTVGLFSECSPLVSRRGIQREGPQPSPFVSFGVWGESKRPSAFLPGCGAGSFPEKNAPHVYSPRFFFNVRISSPTKGSS